MTGCILNTSQTDKETGFLFFIRLVETLYFKRHLAAFVAQKDLKTPRHLFNLIFSLQPREKYEEWLRNIREVKSNCILNEEGRVPTFSSLWRHWQRACWVSQLWQQSYVSDIHMNLPPPEKSGWLLLDDGTYTVGWEAPEVKERIKCNIDILTERIKCNIGF